MRDLSPRRRAGWAGLPLLLPLLVLAGPSHAGPDLALREQEIQQCRPGDLATWGDGRDRPALDSPLLLVYLHEGAPSWFSEAQVRAALERAAQSWSRCGVPSRLLRPRPGERLPAQTVRMQWDEAGSAGNFGLADLGRRRLSLNPAMFALLRERNPRHPAAETLQMVVAHELGHFYGLMAHSRRCIDVTSYYSDGKGGECQVADRALLKAFVEYRSTLPTACDIERCRRANGFAR